MTNKTMSSATGTLADQIERCYRSHDWDGVAAIYAADVVLDVHVPMWRFQLEGPDAANAWFKEQVAHFDNFRITWLRATPTEGGAILEWEMRAGEGDSETLCREVDIFHGDGERITSHVIFCTGMWDQATIARQKAEAPMVRW